jgi:hypothetical protein
MRFPSPVRETWLHEIGVPPAGATPSQDGIERPLRRPFRELRQGLEEVIDMPECEPDGPPEDRPEVPDRRTRWWTPTRVVLQLLEILAALRDDTALATVARAVIVLGDAWSERGC